MSKKINKSKEERVKKQPTFFLAVLPIVIMIVLLGVGYGGLSLYNGVKS